eukprot:9500230-Pyramimonas_sp.AAC.1
MGLVHGLEAKHLRANRDTTGFLSSSRKLSDARPARWSRKEEDRLIGTRCLGTDANDGSARRVGEQSKRPPKARRVA